MSISQSRTKISVYQPVAEPDPLDKIRHACALHCQPYSVHQAGGGSYYVYAGDLKIRFSDHENYSAKHEPPDYNIVNGEFDQEDLAEILESIDYPELTSKTVFAKHLGLTVPKLKKLLTPECYEDVCESEYYTNTFVEKVVVQEALEVARLAGITIRVPIQFGVATYEDYHG